MRSSASTCRKGRRSWPLLLEQLEDRLTPALVTWTNPLGGNWGVVSNWDANRVPTASDDVVIPQAAVTVSHTFGIDSVRSLASQATLVISGGTLALGAAPSQIQNPLTITGRGTLLLGNSTLIGLGTLDNQGTLVALGSSSINGALTNAAGATLRVLGHGSVGPALLTVASGFTNSGLIELTSTAGGQDATLAVGSGTLTNAAAGIIQTLPGTGGGRTLNARIDNQGTIRASQSLAIGNSGRTFTCLVCILSVDGGSVLTVNGGISVFGSGTVLAGSGLIDLAGAHILSLASDLTLPDSGASLTLGGIVIVQGSGTLTNLRTFVVTGDTINVPVVNQGTLVAYASTNLNGALTNAAGATLRVLGHGSVGPALLTVASGFTNSGLIELTSTAGGQDATLAIDSGTLTNAAAGIIQTLPGTGGGRTLNARIDNQGTIRASQSLAISNSGRTFTCSVCILSVDGGSVLTVNGGISVFGSGTVLAGSGFIDLAGAHILSLPSDLTLPGSGASLTLGGIVIVQGPGTLIDLQTLDLTGDTINVRLVNQGTLVTLGSSNVTGALTNAAGATLRVLSHGSVGPALLTVASGFTNSGLIELTSTAGGQDATLAVGSGTLTNAAGGIIQTLSGTGGTRALNARLDNQGTIHLLTGLTVAVPSAAHVNAGTIILVGGDFTVNQSGMSPTFSNPGTVHVGSGSAFTVNGGVFTSLNAGTLTQGTYQLAGVLRFPNASISVNAATIVLEGSGAQIVDQGGNDALANLNRITETGSLTVQYGRNFTAGGTFTNAGTLSVGEGSTFAASFVNFSGTTLTGGTFLVTGTLRVSNALNIETNAATLVLEWPTARVLNQKNANALANFTSNIATGVFRLQGGSSLTTPAFTNAGALVVGVGSTFTANGMYTQTGGTTTLFYGTLTATGTVDLQGGVLTGSGNINASVRNAAVIEVGGTGFAGYLFVIGNYTQTATGWMDIDLGGTTLGVDHDFLYVDGTSTLAGRLNIALLGAYRPNPSDFFIFFWSNGGISGDFTTINGTDLGGGLFLYPFTDGFGYYLFAYLT